MNGAPGKPLSASATRAAISTLQAPPPSPGMTDSSKPCRPPRSPVSPAAVRASGSARARAFIADGATVTICGARSTSSKRPRPSSEPLRTSSPSTLPTKTSWLPPRRSQHRCSPHHCGANAGVGGAAPITMLQRDDWERADHQPDRGVPHVQARRSMLAANGGGAMCAVSSIAGSHTHRFMTAYTVSKAGLNMLVRNAADELGSLGVRVNAVSPGLVETDISTASSRTRRSTRTTGSTCRWVRRGNTADIGAAIRFLCGMPSPLDHRRRHAGRRWASPPARPQHRPAPAAVPRRRTPGNQPRHRVRQRRRSVMTGHVRIGDWLR
ncbi:MAG: SDR family oxidoreductase [Acidimicrobiales bacterium]